MEGKSTDGWIANVRPRVLVPAYASCVLVSIDGTLILQMVKDATCNCSRRHKRWQILKIIMERPMEHYRALPRQPYDQFEYTCSVSQRLHNVVSSSESAFRLNTSECSKITVRLKQPFLRGSYALQALASVHLVDWSLTVSLGEMAKVLARSNHGRHTKHLASVTKGCTKHPRLLTTIRRTDEVSNQSPVPAYYEPCTSSSCLAR